MKLFRADELGAGENTPESEEISNSYNQQKRTAEGGCPHIDQDLNLQAALICDYYLVAAAAVGCSRSTSFKRAALPRRLRR